MDRMNFQTLACAISVFFFTAFSFGAFAQEVDSLSSEKADTAFFNDQILELDGTVFVAQKNLVQMKVDKVVYKVSDDVDSKTSTVLEMLRKVPMVSVDGQDKITVNGSSSFQVYIDGKPNQMISKNASQIFKAMPAMYVKDIEVITNPGAGYDAEGVGGVLNITTNTASTGGNSVSDMQYGSITAQGSNKGGGGSVYYGIQKGKFSLSANANASGTFMKNMVTDIERVQYREGGDITTKTHSSAKANIPIYIGSLSASYDIDSTNTISASASYMRYGSKVRSTGETSIGPMEYGFISDVRSTSSSINATADYQHRWPNTPGRALTISYQFDGTPTSTNTNNSFDSLFEPVTSIVNTNSISNIAQADFVSPIAKNHKLSTGLKYIGRHNSSVQKDVMEYDFYNNIGGIYAEYEGSMGAFGLKAGLRYEHTWQRVNYSVGQCENFKINYGSLVPNASLQYNIGATQNIGLSYNMRITRPGITYLNPYVDMSDPTARTYGNSTLEAESAHNINLVYNYFSPIWIVSATLRQTMVGNGISQYSFYDAQGLLNTTYGNIVSSSSTGLNAFVTWVPGQFTRVILNTGAGWSQFSSKELDSRNSGWNFNAMLGFQQTLPLDFRISANLIYSGKTFSLQGWSSGIAMGMLGLTKSFLDDKLSLSLNGLTSLNGLKMKTSSYSYGKDFHNISKTELPLGSVTFSISWSFGKQDAGKKKGINKTQIDDNQLNSSSFGESIGTMINMKQ